MNNLELKENVGLRVLYRTRALAICTKNNNFNDEEYRKGVIEPYKKIQIIEDDLEKNNRDATCDEIKEALKMLKSVFDTKKISEEEQKFRFNQLFNETGIDKTLQDFVNGGFK